MSFASTIAELTQQQGRDSAAALNEQARIRAQALQSTAQAESGAAAAKGQIWGNAINNIGQSIANIPNAINQAKTLDLQRQDIQAQVEQRKAAAVEQQAKLKKQADDEAESKAIDGILAQSVSPDGTLDTGKFQQQMMVAGHARALQTWQPLLEKADLFKQNQEKAKQELVAQGGISAYQEGTPDALRRSAAILGKSGALTPEEVQQNAQIADAIAQSPSESQKQSVQTAIAHIYGQVPGFEDHLNKYQTSQATLEHVKAQTTEQNALAGEHVAKAAEITHNIENPNAKPVDEFQTFKDAYVKSLGKDNWNQLSPKQQLDITPTYAKFKSDPAADRQTKAIDAQLQQQKREQDFRTLTTARADIQKNADTPYQTAKAAADELRNVVTLAQGGNKIAAAEQSLATAAAVVKSFNLNRINNAEIGVPASAGSAADRFLGLVGKYKDGQPIDSALQKDMLQVADALDKVAAKKYTDTHAGINKLYGTSIPQTFKPDVSAASPAPSSGLTYQDYLKSKGK